MTALTISVLCVSLLASWTAPATVADLQDTKATTTVAAQERDPICGMSVDTAKAKADGRTSQYEGKTFYFCNDSCKKQFDAEPAKFAAQAKADEKTSGMSGCGCCCCKNGGGMAGRGMAGGAAGMGGTAGGMCGRRMR